MNKRGLSQIVTTVILIMLILVALGAIWAIVNNLILKTSPKLNTNGLTLDLKIKDVAINYTTGIATVKVYRNSGAGNLTGVKFIVTDAKGSEIFDQPAPNFYELGMRTFSLNLSSRPNLNITGIKSIEIAPLYITGAGGAQLIGGITDTVKGISDNINYTITTIQGTCKKDADCPSGWIAGTEVCSSDGTSILQKYNNYTCSLLGTCVSSSPLDLVKESCASPAYCYVNGTTPQCISDVIPCNVSTVSTDCGVSDWTGILMCSNDQLSITQNYVNYTCVNNACQSTTSILNKEACPTGEVCSGGQCFVPVECTTNNDCLTNPNYGPGYVCTQGNCTVETPMVNGTIISSWPTGVGEYADSNDLPNNNTAFDIIGYYMIFPGSSQKSCLMIKDFVPPQTSSEVPYVRFNESRTNVTAGDYFEVWQTNYSCSLV